MDASQITKLLQKQNTRYINRCQTVDSSTLTWQNQIQSSKYIKGVKTCEGTQNTNVPTNPCCADEISINGVAQRTGTYSFGGAGRTTALQSGSPQHYLNVLSGASGSAAEVYSSERILLQQAGKESCATNTSPQNSYVVLPPCFCVNTNGPTSTTELSNSNPLPINNQSNPYLPVFDTYYAMKNPQCNYPVQDQNQKHFVKECHSRFPNANNGVNAVFSPCDNVTRMNPDTKQFYTYPVGQNTCDGCIVEEIANQPVVENNNRGIAQWATYLDGTNLDNGNSVTVDSLDNVYVTGSYISSSQVTVMNVSGNGQTPSAITLPETNGDAVFLIKYNSSGIAQWATYLDGTGSDIGYSVTVDSLNNVYITGQYVSSSEINIINVLDNSQTPSLITLPANSSNTVFLIKYNSSGIAQWATYLDRSSEDKGYSIVIDSLNNIYIMGICSSIPLITIMDASGNGQIASDITLQATSNYKVFLIKYNSSGVAQWATYLDDMLSILSEKTYSMTVDSLNNVYITGQYVSSSEVFVMNASGNGQIASDITLPETSGRAIFLIKYNSSGIAQWATYLDGFGDDIGYSVTTDSLNNVYITGQYRSSSEVLVMNASGNGQIASDIKLPANSSNGAAFLIKYNSSGIAQWATYLGGVGDIGYSVTVDSLDNVYITGRYYSSVAINIMNASGNGQIASDITLPATSSIAVFLIKYNSSGIAQWATYLNGTGFDEGYSVITDSLNNIYITGQYNSSSQVTVMNATNTGQIASLITLPATSNNAAFLIKYSNN